MYEPNHKWQVCSVPILMKQRKYRAHFALTIWSRKMTFAQLVSEKNELFGFETPCLKTGKIDDSAPALTVASFSENLAVQDRERHADQVS